MLILSQYIKALSQNVNDAARVILAEDIISRLDLSNKNIEDRLPGWGEDDPVWNIFTLIAADAISLYPSLRENRQQEQ